MIAFLSLVTSFFSGSIITKALELFVIVFQTVLNFISWYLKQFWEGLGVIFHNLSTLTVILAIALGSAWYFKSWDNDKVLAECQKTCPTPIPNQSKYIHPLKKKLHKTVDKVKVQKPKTSVFNPFNGNAP